jgi:hypothetical protein
VRLILAVAVVALGAVVLVAATGQLDRLVASVGSAVGGIVDDVMATPTPTSTPVPVLGSPAVVVPVEAYTNLPTIDLTGTVPWMPSVGAGIASGLPALKDQQPAPITEVPSVRRRRSSSRA